MNLLDGVPHATPLTYAAIAIALIMYLNGDASALQALIGAGVGAIGAGQLGQARNGSGRGIKK